MQEQIANSKIREYTEIIELCKTLKGEGKSVGLVTGCFDIVHAGHVNFFRFAKSKCDVLVVGLDLDESIRITKGDNRPIHKIGERLCVLSELTSIDFLFKFPWIFSISPHSYKIYKNMLKGIKPTLLISNRSADKFSVLKHKACTTNNIIYITQNEILVPSAAA